MTTAPIPEGDYTLIETDRLQQMEPRSDLDGITGILVAAVVGGLFWAAFFLGMVF